ncbi:cytochrome P450 [Apiospora saccharicola]
MGVLTSMEVDSSKLLLIGVASIVVLFIRAAIWKDGGNSKSSILHAPRIPYKLPFGLDMAWKLVTRLHSNTFVEYICDEVLNTAGRTIEMNLLGGDIFITDRAENIKAIQADQFADFAKGQTPHDVFSSILGDSVFTTDGPLWKTSREQLEPHVSRVRPDDIPVAEAHMQKLLGLIKNSPERVDVYDMVDRFQLDLVSQVFLGESTDSLSANEQPFRKAMEELLTFNTNRLLFGRLANLFPDWLFAPKRIVT